MRRFYVFLLALGLVAFAVAFASAACGPCGDVNGTGTVTIGDISCMIACLNMNNCSGIVCPENVDVDGNGWFTAADIDYLIAYLFEDGPAPQCP
ncbi:MAG: hypothetical protein GYA46_10980 [candidate division Zixibacteria bacterium]|nr:hypothetical protein [candidate division Zixibacteria bacterium]